MVLTVMPSVARQLTPLFHDRPVKTWLELLTVERSLKMRNVLYFGFPRKLIRLLRMCCPCIFSLQVEMLVQAALVEAISDFDLVKNPPKLCLALRVEYHGLWCLKL